MNIFMRAYLHTKEDSVMSKSNKYQQTDMLPNDEKLIDMYWERNPDAIQETDRKYGNVLQKVAYNILSDYQDCEECQNDTYFRAAMTSPATMAPTPANRTGGHFSLRMNIPAATPRGRLI